MNKGKAGRRHGNVGRTAKILFMVAVIGILLMACYFLYFGVKRASSSEQIERKLQQLRASEPSVGILTAYYGSEYEIMGTLADMTKQKYADLYGYKYYVDNHLFRNDMSWGQKSAIRTTSVREHLKDHDWVYWTDSEIFVIEPALRLSELIDENYDAIMSKDWGGHQLNPGSLLMKNSATTIEILDVWEYLIDTRDHHDDLRAFEDLIRERPDLGARVKFVHQSRMNAYPDIELKDKSYKREPNSGHAYWQPGDFVVHIVNCLRDWNKDAVCCHGLGAYYYNLFEENYQLFMESLAE